MTREVEELAVIVYRQRNPRSRAVNGWTYVGSTGCIRRATCVFCRCVIATCSAKWPPTKAWGAAIYEHVRACATNYLCSDNTTKENDNG